MTGRPSALVLPAEHMGSPVMTEVLGLLVFSPLDFEGFFKECAPRVHRWLVRRCDDDTMAEDLVAEVFLQAHRKWDRLQYYKNPHAWVFLVAQRMLWKYQRSAARQQTTELPELHDHRVGDIESMLDFDRALAELSGSSRRLPSSYSSWSTAPLRPRSCST